MPTFKEYALDNGLVASMENLDGTTVDEMEYCFYVELADLEQLRKKAFKSERHEQWLIPLAKEDINGKMRIRLIDESQPTICVKTNTEEEIRKRETEQIISRDLFNNLRNFGVEGYYKTRYMLASNIRGLVWEVDVFFSNGGAQHPWVKVDLEVKDMNSPIPQFPLELNGNPIYGDGHITYTEKQKIQSLWEKEWMRIDQQVGK